MKNARLVVLVALILGLVMLGQAQTFRARVQGIVTDESHAVITNATVTLLNVNTGIKTVRQTSDTGLYLFDGVDPGTYSVTVEIAGFNKFVQENILVQSGGDVTVNATLKPGSVQTTVTITETPAAVEFNSSNKDITLDNKMVAETPRIDRNPFKLTLLAPAAINTRGEMQPYHSWAANSVDLGGGTNLKNDLEVDGSPIGLGHKNSYPPNTDAVQEVIVSTNSVDAESGHSAGGQISMTTKSGTNEWHGTGFYLGRYPWLSAAADRTTFNYNAQRQQMYGGTLGNPILKNKLFNFFSLEKWKIGQPNNYVNTMPTSSEQNGDFSQSYYLDNGATGVRTVYDPYTTVLNPNGSVTVTPFANNKIPTSRFDPLTGKLMKEFWAGNNPGDNITGVNNFKKGYTETFNYYNYSERADFNLNDKWKFFGRVGRYHTDDVSGNPTGAVTDLYVPTGTLRAAWQVSGDAIWSVSSRTVVSFHGDWHDVVDAYVSPDMGKDGWSKIWTSNDWYKVYQDAAVGVPVYFPHMQIGGTGVGGGGFYWDQRPGGQAYNVKISHQAGSHFLKAGVEHRRSYGLSYVSSTSNFNFNTSVTAETYSNPNTARNGDQFATFLLGSLDGSSSMIGGPSPDNHTEFYGFYFQDDWKISRRLTLNLGIRDDYETAWHDPMHQFSRGMDLNATTPEIAANPPVVPGAVSDITGANPWKYTGMWSFTSSGHPGMWNAPKIALQPRVGFAFRVDDKTSIRGGYARYTIPTEYNLDTATGFETVSFLEPPFFGQTGYQNTLGQLAGIPQQTFSDPFPAGKNPLLPIIGNGYGSNLGRGGETVLWYPQDFQKPWNDRFNIQFQRQLPGEVVVSATYFTNFGHQLYTRNYNATDPRYAMKYQNQLSQTVANPFYNYLTSTLFPSGSLRSQETVTLSSLLKPWPQYGDLFQVGTCCAKERYNSIEFKLQKAFSKGYNFLATYVYIKEKTEINSFNDFTTFMNAMQWQDSDQPRHHFNVAGTYEIPVGHGRQYMNKIPKAADFLIGGWKITAVSTFMTGSFPRFGNLIVNGNPCLSSPTRNAWFNTSAFSQLPANTYVLRTNPLQYDCLTGPAFWTLDSTLSKSFNITERVRTEFKMNAYNATNRLNLGSPNTDINSSQFGTSLYQGSPGGSFGAQGQTSNASGRQVELGLKLIF